MLLNTHTLLQYHTFMFASIQLTDCTFSNIIIMFPVIIIRIMRLELQIRFFLNQSSYRGLHIFRKTTINCVAFPVPTYLVQNMVLKPGGLYLFRTSTSPFLLLSKGRYICRRLGSLIMFDASWLPLSLLLTRHDIDCVREDFFIDNNSPFL